MYVSPRLPLGVALVAVISAVVPWHLAASVLGLVILAAAVVADVRRAPGPDELSVSRDAPNVATVGRTGTIAVRLHNPADRPLPIALHDAAPPSLHRDPIRHAVVLEPGGWSRCEAFIRPTRRGTRPLGPVTVRAAGPLGLAGRQRRIPLPASIDVYPALPGRAEVELRLGRARMLAAGERTSAIRGGGTDFESLREYRLDDEFRRINWKATARSSKPISNEYREDRNQQIVLLMDASRTMAATVNGVSRFEHALDAGFAVAQLASRAGDHVGMVAFDREVVAMLAPRGGPAQPRAIVSMLFGLEPTLDAPNYGRAFTTLLARHRRRSLLILLSEVSELSQIEGLLRALPVLLARHLVLLATVRDPGVEAMATATPSSSEQAYAKAAAAGALLARDQATARLKRLGVIVVDAPPGRLAGQLADRYLRIKATGRL